MSTWWILGACAGALAARAGWRRLELSRAKHPSLRGHARMALRVSRWVPYYELDGERFFAADGAPAEVAEQRKRAFAELSGHFQHKAPRSLALSREIQTMAADLEFVNAYRVPFAFRKGVQAGLPVASVYAKSDGLRITDADGNTYFDLGGSYGVNVLGYSFYKRAIAESHAIAGELGPLLGAYHPIVLDNLRRLKELSGLDQTTFHMSGTEAVMQAVRLARYHTRRRMVVRFCGAYHGWWDGVQAGPGNPLPARDVYTLNDMSEAALRVLRKRTDIACVLINPIQSMHPNAAAPSDGTLLAQRQPKGSEQAAYREWLQRLRQVCTERGIALILDDVFLGFRFAPGGTQEYFGIRADLVTYGKSLGGGYPIGVVCGSRRWMMRYRQDRPADICFARGTFNSHPYVMAAMNVFLRQLEEPAVRAHYAQARGVWAERVERLNRSLVGLGVPVRIAAWETIWLVQYDRPSRYHWMFQYYLRRRGLALNWIGTGRILFPLHVSEQDFSEIEARFLAAAQDMRDAGWWWGAGVVTAKTLRRIQMREMAAAVWSRIQGGRNPVEPEAVLQSAASAKPAGAVDWNPVPPAPIAVRDEPAGKPVSAAELEVPVLSQKD
jgi:glutamate-1-semialdehyde 2,1-aminomutase